jgi:outer membrane protein assembly factor BamA
VGLSYHSFSYEVFKETYPGEYTIDSEEKLSTVLPMVSWIYDNSVFGYTGPLDGFRQNISVTATPGIGMGKIKFQTVIWDIRKYIRIWKYYAFAGRLMIGKSMGHDPQKFFLGGAHNWYFGRGETDGKDDSGQFREVMLDEDKDGNDLLKDIYFSEYAMPVRGARYAERTGTNVALANFEFRFPFIFAFGPPSRVAATYLFGHAFLDVGAAWDDFDEFNDQPSPKVAGFGIGFKLFTPLGLLRVDTAWDIKPGGSYSRPQYLFSFGPDW